MKRSPNGSTNISKNGNGFLPYSIKFISSCIKTVSSNVRSAGASVAGSISGDSSADDRFKDQVLWTCFDRLELGPSLVKRVLLIGYYNGFQVLDVEDASNICELVSKRDDPVTFLQIQPLPATSDDCEGFLNSHPILLVVASDDKTDAVQGQNGKKFLSRNGYFEPQAGNRANSPMTVRFYSLVSHSYVHFLRFRSTVHMFRCSPRIVAVGLAAQIYCIDALTLETKFSVLTYPAPQLGAQGLPGVNIGYGPMAVGPRWLAYSTNNPLLSNTVKLSPQSLTPSPGVSPSTSPSSGNLVARYAMESSKHLAAGFINLGDMGYKTFSKYCHELLPDGSGSPVSSNGSWKVGRAAAHATETDAAGMVTVKDFMSGAIVSQFKAHASPISALCFDPSGTLLVTASIHGNNINIFRIMPSYLQNGSRSYDWVASHVHLYKLHRGVTPAVIQDICFSSYSQWIAIISSRGTCHVFVLSPFGGETGLQLVNSHADGPTLLPVLSMPWWSTTSFLANQQFSPPPPATLTLSVVSRIKTGGWLSTVSNAASSAAGKVLVPSGVIAAVFHSCLHQNMPSASLKSGALEHLLVYSPSGHLIEYQLLPLLGREQGESSLRNGLGSSVQMQEDELRVKFEPAQWWDVCRRAGWPEREESIYGIRLGRLGALGPVMGASSCFDNDIEEKEQLKPLDRSHLNLSNAEVQLRSGRVPIWQKSKIYFYTIDECEEINLSEALIGGEIEIEKLPVTEVDMRQKDLLPIFDPFHRINPAWDDDRKHVDKRFTAPIISSHDSVGESKGCSRLSASLDDYDEKGMLTSSPYTGLAVDESGVAASPPLNQKSFNSIRSSGLPESSVNILPYVEECYVVNSPTTPESARLVAALGTLEIQPSQGVATDEIPRSNTNLSDTSVNFVIERQVHEDVHHPIGFGQYFREGYCKASTSGESHDSTEVAADTDSTTTNHGDKEKTEEAEESDDILGSVFAFSEEELPSSSSI